MSVNVKNGLGLLVVAVLAGLLSLPFATSGGSSSLVNLAGAVLTLVCAGCLFVGLVLIALGLLRRG